MNPARASAPTRPSHEAPRPSQLKANLNDPNHKASVERRYRECCLEIKQLEEEMLLPSIAEEAQVAQAPEVKLKQLDAERRKLKDMLLTIKLRQALHNRPTLHSKCNFPYGPTSRPSTSAGRSAEASAMISPTLRALQALHNSDFAEAARAIAMIPESRHVKAETPAPGMGLQPIYQSPIASNGTTIV